MAVVLLPNGKQQFNDGNGKPLAGGSVYMYVPNTSPPQFATTWQDINQIGENTNPIELDADGRCIIWGNGIYRQVVYDINGVLVWDELTSAPADLSSISTYYDLAILATGVLANSEIFSIFNIVRNEYLPAGLTLSKFSVGVNPTSTATITIKKNGSSIGSLSISTLGVVTVTFASLVSFVPGDQITFVGQSSADATMANIAGTLVFTVTS